MRAIILRRAVWVLALAGALGGCAFMPSSGPSVDAIETAAAKPDTPTFILVDVDDKVVLALADRREITLSSSIRTQARPANRVISVGDVVEVTIWEASSGGLFSSSSVSASTVAGASGAGANSITIPAQRVDASGRITVPYAGRIRAAGRRPTEVAKNIVRALQGRAIEPQALVNVKSSAANQATVLGDAVSGARVPLVGEDERLLDVIAAAGAVTAPIYNITVRLTREGATAEAPLHRVIADPRENIIMQPGDVVTLFKDPETFTAFGATGKSTLESFDDERLMLDEALAKVGGVIDARGDPAGVFIFRFEPIDLATALGVTDVEGATLPEHAVVPVAYRINLSEPEGFFFARNFAMRNKDVLFVANSEASELQKVLTLVGSVLSPATRGASLGASVAE